MERLVKNTAEDSGVWQVVVCASAAHARRLDEIKRLRTEHEQLKTKMGGEFGQETSRKRVREETKEEKSTDFWVGFEDNVRDGKGFDPAL
jgi:uncharacterized protein (DUF2147 family)